MFRCKLHFHPYTSAGMSLLISLLAILLVFFYQNCANTQLTREELPVLNKPYLAPSLSFAATACSTAKEMPDTNAGTKYVVIIDMSLSNIGNPKSEQYTDNDGDIRTGSFFDTGPATDFSHNRFTEIIRFINNRDLPLTDIYSLIVFSFKAGAMETSGGIHETPAKFVSKSDITSQLNNSLAYMQSIFQTYQTNKNLLTDIAKIPIAIPNPGDPVTGTNYGAALKSLKTLIEDDLLNSIINSSGKLDEYKVFFISDGAPNDAHNEVKDGLDGAKELIRVEGECSGKPIGTSRDTCYSNQATNFLSAIKSLTEGSGTRFDFRTIYYGKPETAGATVNVPSILTTMSKLGSNTDPILLTDTRQLESTLSALTTGKASTQYEPDSLMIVPLTSIRKNGKVWSDSSMSGMTDDEKRDYQGDPTKARSIVTYTVPSTGAIVYPILDGICLRFGSKSECQAQFDTMQSLSDTTKKCNPEYLKINSIGLSECDIKMLGLSELGIDSKQDGVNDFLKILKGLDPLTADLLSDLDRDGLTLKEELIRGLDPTQPDADFDPTLINIINIGFRSVATSSPSCLTGEHYAEILQMQVQNTKRPYSTIKIAQGPFAETVSQAMDSTTPSSIFDRNKDLNHHEAGEEVLMVQYRLSPISDSGENSVVKYFVDFIKVKYSTGMERAKLEASPTATSRFNTTFTIPAGEVP